MSPQDASDRVIVGLREACGPAIPRHVLYMYGSREERNGQAFILSEDSPDPPGFMTPEFFHFQSVHMWRLCPSYYDSIGWAVANSPAPQRGYVLYDGCELSRYDVITREEAGLYAPSHWIWAVHQHLLEEPITKSQANTITRAFFVRENQGSDGG